ncbi:MAG: hypothetical protein IIY06_01120 [Proteobacteria bacterium]|nr:hypothetical protein [Pseudomonadota bacterium]
MDRKDASSNKGGAGVSGTTEGMSRALFARAGHVCDQKAVEVEELWR